MIHQISLFVGYPGARRGIVVRNTCQQALHLVALLLVNGMTATPFLICAVVFENLKLVLADVRISYIRTD
jgi:hypothetical protein